MTKTPAKGPGGLNAKQALFAKEYLPDDCAANPQPSEIEVQVI